MKGRGEFAEYVVSLSHELADLAKQHDCTVLAYLLGMVKEQAALEREAVEAWTHRAAH